MVIYGDAGKFFMKEMELKRKYREAPSVRSNVSEAFFLLLLPF